MSDANVIRVLLVMDGGKQYSVEINKATDETREFGKTSKTVSADAAVLEKSIRGLAGGFGVMAAIQVGTALSGLSQRFDAIEQRLGATAQTSAGARREWEFTVEEADRLGASIFDLAEQYGDLTNATRGTRLEGQATRDIFSAVIEAATKQKRSQQELEGILKAVNDMVNKNVVSQEEWRQQLGEKLPGAALATARALGVTTEQLNEMIERGEVTAEQLLPALARGLRETFSTDSETRIESHAASFTRLRNEIKLLADGVGGPLNTVLATASDLISGPLRFVREGGLYGAMTRRNATRDGSFLMYEDGSARNWNTMEKFQPMPYSGPYRDVIDPRFTVGQYTGDMNRQQGPRVDVPRVEAGGSLTEAQEKRLMLLREEFELQQLKTNEEKVYFQITQGRYAEETKQAKDQLLANAKLRDEVEAKTQAEREAASTGKQAEADRLRQAKDLQAESERQARAAAEKQASIDDMIQRREIEVALIGVTDAAERFAIERQLGLYDELSDAQVAQLELLAQRQAAADQALQTERDTKRELRERLELEQRLRREADRQLRADPRAAAFGIRSLEDLEQRMDPLQAAARDIGDVLHDSFSTAGRSISDMAAEMILFGNTSDEALKQVGRALVQNLLSGLIQVGLQMGVNFVAAKIFGTAATTTAAAQATGLAAAWAPAAIAANIATFGAAGAAGMAGYLGSLGAATAASTAAATAGSAVSIGAGREYGGDVAPGRAYPFGERGRPEILEMGGDFFLLPGNRGGRVVPPRAAGGAGMGGLTVNIQRVPDSLRPQVSLQGDVVTVDMVPALLEQASALTRGDLARGIRSGRDPVTSAISSRYGLAQRLGP